MSEESSEKSALVPRLRFPQFSEAWRADRVGKIAEIFKGKGIAKSDINNDGIHSCIRYGELYTVYGELVTKVLSRTSLPATELFFGEPNDVIIPSSGETKEDIATAACVIPGGIAFGGDLNVLRTMENGAFLSYYLNGPLRKNIACVAQGDSVVHLYPHQIEKLPIAIPVGNEQQKIADCLSSLDELITAETKKLDALKTHKKGLMQQLFPREGETVPRLRFPEFREAGEWEEKAVGDVFRVTRGEVLAMPRVKDAPSAEFPYPVYSSQTKNNGLAGYYSEYLYEDAITWTTDGANAGEVNFRPGRFYCTNVCGVLLNSQGWTNTFVAALLNTVTRKYVSYVGNPKLMNGVMSEIVIPFPLFPEQQRIADFLSSLDDLMTAQSQKIDALKCHKKGLMQQLFPVLDEVQA